jgi:hypothetical protein
VSQTPPEAVPTPEPVPTSEPVPLPEAVPTPEAAAEKARQRRDLLIAGALVLAAALGGGGYLLLGSGGSGHPAEAAQTAAPTPAATRAYGVTAGGSHYGDLGELLLPLPRTMEPGPDVQSYGNDTVLGAAQAKAMLEGGDGSSHLTAKERKQADALLDAMQIKGAALRTYHSKGGGWEYVVTVVQVGNKKAAAQGPETFRKLSSQSDVFTKGPAVPGHPHAVCVLPSDSARKDDGADWLDGMYCQATEGDLMIQFQATGPAPLPRSEAVDLVDQQLDRVQAPGEGV